jgi:hypothetical protein
MLVSKISPAPRRHGRLYRTIPCGSPAAMREDLPAPRFIGIETASQRRTVLNWRAASISEGHDGGG